MISGGKNRGFAFALGLAAATMLVILFIGFIGSAGFGVATTTPFILGVIGPLIAFFCNVISSGFVRKSK